MIRKMVVLVAVLASAAFAVPGNNAGNMPMGTATIDGDLSDWAGAAWRTNTLVMGYFTGTNVPGNEDVVLSTTEWAARWEAPSGGNPGYVYAAAKIVDNTHTLTDAFTEWCASDRVEWLVHGINATSAAFNSSSAAPQENGQQYVMGVMASDSSTPWIEVAYKMGAPITGMIGDCSVSGNALIYEAKIPVFDAFGGYSGNPTVVSPLAVGEVIGFDILVGSAINPYPGSYVNSEYYLLDEEGVSAGTYHKADGSADNMQVFTLVPEPMTMSLLALGGIAVIRRRK